MPKNNTRQKNGSIGNRNGRVKNLLRMQMTSTTPPPRAKARAKVSCATTAESQVIERSNAQNPSEKRVGEKEECHRKEKEKEGRYQNCGTSSKRVKERVEEKEKDSKAIVRDAESMDTSPKIAEPSVKPSNRCAVSATLVSDAKITGSPLELCKATFNELVLPSENSQSFVSTDRCVFASFCKAEVATPVSISSLSTLNDSPQNSKTSPFFTQ